MPKSVAIVTGASQGIGQATAIRLARDFSSLVLVALDVSGHVAFETRRVIPMGTGEVAGAPFAPVRIGSLDVDTLVAIPETAQTQMRVKRSEGTG